MTSTTITMTSDNALTSLCIWEEMLALRDKGHTATMDRVWDATGSWEMRQEAINLAPQFDDLWTKLNGDEAALDGMAFDWEFVPLLLPYVCWVGMAGGWTMSDEAIDALVTGEHARLMGRAA